MFKCLDLPPGEMLGWIRKFIESRHYYYNNINICKYLEYSEEELGRGNYGRVVSIKTFEGENYVVKEAFPTKGDNDQHYFDVDIVDDGHKYLIYHPQFNEYIFSNMTSSFRKQSPLFFCTYNITTCGDKLISLMPKFQGTFKDFIIKSGEMGETEFLYNVNFSFLCIIHGLVLLSKYKIMHNDVKLDNILMQSVSDFKQENGIKDDVNYICLDFGNDRKMYFDINRIVAVPKLSDWGVSCMFWKGGKMGNKSVFDGDYMNKPGRDIHYYNADGENIKTSDVWEGSYDHYVCYYDIVTFAKWFHALFYYKQYSNRLTWKTDNGYFVSNDSFPRLVFDWFLTHEEGIYDTLDRKDSALRGTNYVQIEDNVMSTRYDYDDKVYNLIPNEWIYNRHGDYADSEKGLGLMKINTSAENRYNGKLYYKDNGTGNYIKIQPDKYVSHIYSYSYYEDGDEYGGGGEYKYIPIDAEYGYVFVNVDGEHILIPYPNAYGKVYYQDKPGQYTELFHTNKFNSYKKYDVYYKNDNGEYTRLPNITHASGRYYYKNNNGELIKFELYINTDPSNNEQTVQSKYYNEFNMHTLNWAIAVNENTPLGKAYAKKTPGKFIEYLFNLKTIDGDRYVLDQKGIETKKPSGVVKEFII